MSANTSTGYHALRRKLAAAESALATATREREAAERDAEALAGAAIQFREHALRGAYWHSERGRNIAMAPLEDALGAHAARTGRRG